MRHRKVGPCVEGRQLHQWIELEVAGAPAGSTPSGAGRIEGRRCERPGCQAATLRLVDQLDPQLVRVLVRDRAGEDLSLPESEAWTAAKGRRGGLGFRS